MDKDDIETIFQRRKLPWRIVAKRMFSVRLLRYANQQWGELNGWLLMLSFGVGAISVQFCARDWQSYTLMSGVGVWFWPARIHFKEGDTMFRYHWQLVDRIYL